MDIYSEKKAMKDLNSLYAEAVYGKPKSAGQELADREKDDDAFGAPKKKMVVTRADKKGNTPAYQNYKKGDKRYTAADHLKREEYGELYSNVYNELQEKQKDTPDQVKAVIAYDKARKGTDDATYDSEHGKKKQAKKERDYAKWQRDKGAEDAQKSGHPWEHAKGSTREKEGKKSEKHAHIKDSFSNWRNDLVEYTNTVDEPESKADRKVKESKVKNKVVIDPEVKLEQALGGKVEVIEEKCGCDCGEVPCITCGGDHHAESKENKVKEEILWDRVAIALTELGEMNEVQFTVVVREGQVKKELKDLSKASKTLKGKYVAKADEVEEEILLDRAVVAIRELEEMIGIDEAERNIDDRLDRKNKLMKKTVRKAMDFARDEGEASGHARFNMSRLGREREKLIAKKK